MAAQQSRNSGRWSGQRKAAVRRAEKAHRQAVKSAEKNLKAAENEYANNVTAAEKQLADLRDPKGQRIASCRDVTLYERAITTANGTGPLQDVTVSVDTAGNLATKSRATLTRMAAGGIVLGPLGAVLSLGLKKHKNVDGRELYLLIDSPTVASVTQCPPDDGKKGRDFAAKIRIAAARAAEAERSLPARLEDAQRRLAAAQDTAGKTPVWDGSELVEWLSDAEVDQRLAAGQLMCEPASYEDEDAGLECWYVD